MKTAYKKGILIFQDYRCQVFIHFSPENSPSAIPVLESETVTSDLPHRLVIVGRSLSCQKKVLIEETLFVPFKLDCSTSHHEQCSLTLGCLVVNWLTIQRVHLEFTRRQRLKKLAQRILT